MDFTVVRNYTSASESGGAGRTPSVSLPGRLGRPHRLFALAAVAATTLLIASACATNPATGGHNVVLTTVKGEQDQARRVHQEIIQFYGLYEDQSVQDYVQRVGARVAAQTPIASWNFKFFVLDD